MHTKKAFVLDAQLYLTLSEPTDCSMPGSSVHGTLQVRILVWVAMPSTRGSSRPRDRTWIFCIAGRVFIVWAIKKHSFVAILPLSVLSRFCTPSVSVRRKHSTVVCNSVFSWHHVSSLKFTPSGTGKHSQQACFLHRNLLCKHFPVYHWILPGKWRSSWNICLVNAAYLGWGDGEG